MVKLSTDADQEENRNKNELENIAKDVLGKCKVPNVIVGAREYLSVFGICLNLDEKIVLKLNSGSKELYLDGCRPVMF